MEIPVSCTCGKSFKAKATLAGKTVACPGCKSPITIPAAPAPAQQSPLQPLPPQPPAPAPAAPAPIAPAAGAEILMACSCGQQFKVDSQFAGQQVNCPSCQALCVIPAVQQPAAPQPVVQQPVSAFSAAMPQQPPPQPMMQQPMMQQPGYPPAGGMGQMDYQQPAYGGPARRATYKTGLGIFIFAIAATVFAGGYGIDTLLNLIFKISAWSEARLPYSMYDFIVAMLKLAGVAQMLGITAMVVASVFMMLSRPPLFGIGIALIATSGTATIFYAMVEGFPRLDFGSRMYGSGGLTMRIFNMIALNGTFILCSVYMYYAVTMKRTRVATASPLAALYGFSIATILTLVNVMIATGSIDSISLKGTEVSGQGLMIFAEFLQIVTYASMIVGLVFLIVTLFQSRSAYR